ncbi:MAG TPA: hypothetical protein VII83_05825 [Gaiellaceae bacterium]
MLCLDLGLANAQRIGTSVAARGALGLTASIVLFRQPRLRLGASAALLLHLCLKLGSLRLSSLDRSPLLSHVGVSAKARVVVVACFVVPEIL